MKPLTRLFDLLDLYQDKYRDKSNVFLSKSEGSWHAFSAVDYVTLTRDLSMGMLNLGINPGTHIATVMANCPEWNLFDMAIMQIGAVQVPIYPNISEENYQYILSDARIEYMIVYNQEIYERIRPIVAELPFVKGIYSIQEASDVPQWTEILEAGKLHPHPERLEEIKTSILPDDLASIIYTSGTTGLPKGVMLSHWNFVSNFLECARIPDFSSKDRALSFLPLCHVYERMLNYVYQYLGMSVYYAQSLDFVAAYLQEVRPHTFAAVPRMLEKIYNKMVSRGRSMKGIRKMIFFWALRQGYNFELNHTRGWGYEITLFIANRLVFSKWRSVLGGNVRIIVSGGASLHPRLARIFWAARLKVMEGYGLTETAPVIAVQTLEKGGVKFGTVGPILPGIEVTFAQDGEILCRGPNLMRGYYNKPELTHKVIDKEGWFHTGDIGLMVDGKYLKITDRKKEIFKTSTGKYIAPQPIEQRFAESPFIDHIIVIGEDRKYTAALIVPNFEYLRSWCEVKQISYQTDSDTITTPRIIGRMQEEVKRINLKLGQTEKIKKFRLLATIWSVETGELSPTLKLRRKFIQEKYYEEIENTYKSPEHDYKVDQD